MANVTIKYKVGEIETEFNIEDISELNATEIFFKMVEDTKKEWYDDIWLNSDCNFNNWNIFRVGINMQVFEQIGIEFYEYEVDIEVE